jgi:hypothetical protein
MRALADVDLLAASRTFDGEALADELENLRKKRRHAYLAWLCLGAHYLYLRRPFTQALFWLSLGGLLIWWLADLLRIPSLVERHNRLASTALIRSWQHRLEQRLPASPTPWPMSSEQRPLEAHPAPVVVAPLQPEDDPLGQLRPPATGRRTVGIGAAMSLAALLATIALVHIVAPRPVYPRAVLEPSYRTLRQVNVRELPSTSSPIRGIVAKNILLRGTIEERPASSPSTWLRLTRGAHQGRYVALQNLDRR